MLQLAVLGDIHDEQERLGRVLRQLSRLRFDLALLAGDVGQDPPWSAAARRTERAAHDDSLRRVIAGVGAVLGCPVAFVPGNHDLQDPPADVGGINLDRRLVTIGNLRLAGLGGAGPGRFGFPYEWSEAEADAALSAMFPQGAVPLDIFLSHTPPAATPLDLTAHGEHVGSHAVAGWIERLQPKLFVCGHIHEAPGLATLHGIPCLNAGSLGEPYGQEIAWWVEWNDGPVRIERLTGD